MDSSSAWAELLGRQAEKWRTLARFSVRHDSEHYLSRVWLKIRSPARWKISGRASLIALRADDPKLRHRFGARGHTEFDF
jgi:hypothetical protein